MQSHQSTITENNMHNPNLFELMTGLLKGQSPAETTTLSRKEKYLAVLRRNHVLRKRLKKQDILKAGCDMGNAQALVRRAERRLTGRIVTPLHAPVVVDSIPQNTNQ